MRASSEVPSILLTISIFGPLYERGFGVFRKKKTFEQIPDNVAFRIGFKG